MNVNVGFLFLAVQTRLVLSVGVCPQSENDLFILPRYNEQAGEGGRLADRALITLSQGFDKQLGRGIFLACSSLIEVLRVRASVLSYRSAVTLLTTDTLWLNSHRHERGKS